MTTNTFRLDYSVSGTERKRLVQAISAYTQADAKYLGAPTFAYQVDYFHIDRNGVVSFDDRADSEEIEGLIETLAEQGFVAQGSDPGGMDEPDERETEPHGVGLTVTIPISSFPADAQNNLHSLIGAKGKLIRKALGIDLLPVQVDEDTISFPWFEGKELNGDEVKAYTHFISALCEMARNQKRITAKEKDTDNDKYAFRCFLLRLGFIGAEYKEERKILLRNLSGSSAFKSGSRKESAPGQEPIDPSKAVELPEGVDPELAEAMLDAALIHQINTTEVLE